MESTEKWLPVVGYEGIYEVSDMGRVRSVDRHDSRGVFWRSRVLKPATEPRSGYRYVGLRTAGEMRTWRIHVLVTAAFLGPRPQGADVCHNDGDPGNNAVGNLRYDTRSENGLDRTRHGTDHDAVKTHCPRGHELVEPNLSIGHLKKGRRQCRACNLEHAKKSALNETFSTERADDNYIRIMSTK